MTDEKQEENVKIVFQDDNAKEDVPSTADLANAKFLDDQVDFDRKVDPGSTRPLEEDGFVGVDPEYRNYASVAHKPFFAEEGTVNEALETYALGPVEDAAEEVDMEEVEEEESSEPVSPTPNPDNPPSLL